MTGQPSLHKATPQIGEWFPGNDSSSRLWDRHTGPSVLMPSSPAVAEAGGLSWMSHRPKVPSTLKLLEGIEVSLLLSLEFFHFLFLASVKLFVPVVDHGLGPGQSAVLNGILTDRRRLTIPCQNLSSVSLV